MTSNDDKPIHQPELEAALDRLFADLPEGFRGRYEAAQRIRSAFYERLAKVLEPSLNDHVAKLPTANLREQQRLTAWIDKVTRDIGLSVAGPVSGSPALLIAEHPPGASRDRTRFAFVILPTPRSSDREQMSRTIPYIPLIQASRNMEKRFDEIRAETFPRGRSR